MISKSFENDTSFTMLADNGYVVGVDMDVYEYDIASAEITWFPMDFEKYVS